MRYAHALFALFLAFSPLTLTTASQAAETRSAQEIIAAIEATPVGQDDFIALISYQMRAHADQAAMKHDDKTAIAMAASKRLAANEDALTKSLVDEMTALPATMDGAHRLRDIRASTQSFSFTKPENFKLFRQTLTDTLERINPAIAAPIREQIQKVAGRKKNDPAVLQVRQAINASVILKLDNAFGNRLMRELSQALSS